MVRVRAKWARLLTALGLLAGGLACNVVSGLANGVEATATPRATRTPASDPTDEPVEDPTEEAEPTEEPTEEVEPTEAPTEAKITEEPEATAEPQAGAVVFADDFETDANGWDVDESDTAARQYRDGLYAIEVFNTVWFAWANPTVDDLTDIHLQVTVRNAGGNDPAFGVLCSYKNSDAFYFLGFGDDGYYGIARIEGDEFILLTGEENSWTRSDDIELFQDSYVLEADCRADGTLRLVVDGVTIAEAQDSAPYGAGGIGLFVQSFDNVPVEVEFDDLVVTQLTE